MNNLPQTLPRFSKIKTSSLNKLPDDLIKSKRVVKRKIESIPVI